MDNRQRSTIYNSRIAYLRMLIPSPRSLRVTELWFVTAVLLLAQTVSASDWSAPEARLASKIAAVTGPGAVALELTNRSSLTREEFDEISRGLRTQLAASGLRFGDADQATAAVKISFSEDLQNYVWIAEIHQGVDESSVVMIFTPRTGGFETTHDAKAVTIHKALLWVQPERILDVAVMDGTPTHMAVLDANQIALYGDMPLPMQSKLLRVLEESEVERIGGDKSIRVDVRVLVATHRNLETLVRENRFRQDLFHRVYVFPLVLPPLRERRDDVPALVENFAGHVCAQNGWKRIPFSSEAVLALQAYVWPGNVRELRNVVERLLLLATDGEVNLETVRSALPQLSDVHTSVGSGPLAERVLSFERDVILAELKRSHYHITNAAKALGLERSHLYKKAEQLEIDLQALRQEPADGKGSG